MANSLIRAVARWLPLATFKGSQDYWRQRYRFGGDSGVGSMGEAALHKAAVLNRFVALERVESIIEFGCGDGRQLELAEYPRYLGVDISPEAIRECRERFRTDPDKRFVEPSAFDGATADLILSLDVIYHLVEDKVYDAYMRQLFAASTRFVIVYSSDVAATVGNFRHVRHRAVSADIEKRFPDFVRLVDKEAELPEPVAFNRGIPTKFLIYQRLPAA